MSKKANSKLIGIFVLGALILIIAGILVFGSGKFLEDKDTFVLYFDSSVNGLNVGAPVKFKGVQIGEVTRIGLELHLEDIAFRTPVFIETVKGAIREVGGTRIASEDIKTVGGGETDLDILKFLVRRGLSPVSSDWPKLGS